MADPTANNSAIEIPDGDLSLESCDEAVRRSFAYCHRVTRQRARNFYYGLKLTPEPKRSALYVIYAFMRACDDLADEPPERPGPPESSELPGWDHGVSELDRAGLARLDQFDKHLDHVLRSGFSADQLAQDMANETVPAAEIWPAFHHVMRTYPINPNDLHAMLDGQRCDLRQRSYQTFDELRDYCYKVAGVVGLVCISVWGYSGGEQTRRLAEDRGIALQLTNILRDLVEDAQRGRVYLPADELERFDIDPRSFARQLISGNVGEPFDRLMRFQIDRARGYYDASQELERHIDPAV